MREGLVVGVVVAVVIVVLLVTVFGPLTGKVSNPISFTCTDTDEGDDPENRGIVTVINDQTGEAEQFEDFCQLIDVLNEYFCEENGRATSRNTPCVCEEGRCTG